MKAARAGRVMTAWRRRSRRLIDGRAHESRAALRLPLSVLCPLLEPASSRAQWSIDPDRVPGRALGMNSGAAYTVPLTLDCPVRFDARAMLLPHDWLNGLGTVVATVAVTTGGGSSRTLWRGELRAGDRGRPSGLAIDVAVPADSRSLRLSLDGPARPGHRQVTRAIWVQPTLHDPRAASAEARTRSASPRAAARAANGGSLLISVLTPVHDPPAAMLEEAIGSVLSQRSADWELCLVDDGCRDPQIKAALKRYAEQDARITLVEHGRARGIAAATNTLLEIAAGRYIALLDHDDTLAPDALQQISDRIEAEPDLDMLYSDEDTVLDGKRVWAHLKPAWSPDTMRTNGYTCHLGVYRRELVQEIGGFRDEFNGSQDVDMILRLMERTDRIAHVPKILYHWRAHGGSTAGGDAKPYAYVAARRAIAGHVERLGLHADVGYGPPGLYRLAHRVDPALTVEIVLACDDPDSLRCAARSWAAQPHPAWRIVVATRNHDAIAQALHAADIPDDRTTVIEAHSDPATALHDAARRATAEHLLLMQAPAVGLTHAWLTRLLGYSGQPGIAAAGPVILASDGRIQQAGIALPDGIPLYLLNDTRSSMDDFFGYGTSVYNVSAVSGVLATARATYERLGGLRPAYRGLAMIEYCLRAGRDGGRTVIVPDARMRVDAPVINDLPAIRRLRDEWAATHGRELYYNPGFRTDRGSFEVR
ncbi:MAG: glycosyltransferase [Solirubrobacteraceae bacterium]